MAKQTLHCKENWKPLQQTKFLSWPKIEETCLINNITYIVGDAQELLKGKMCRKMYSVISNILLL